MPTVTFPQSCDLNSPSPAGPSHGGTLGPNNPFGYEQANNPVSNVIALLDRAEAVKLVELYQVDHVVATICSTRGAYFWDAYKLDTKDRPLEEKRSMDKILFVDHEGFHAGTKPTIDLESVHHVEVKISPNRLVLGLYSVNQGKVRHMRSLDIISSEDVVSGLSRWIPDVRISRGEAVPFERDFLPSESSQGTNKASQPNSQLGSALAGQASRPSSQSFNQPGWALNMQGRALNMQGSRLSSQPTDPGDGQDDSRVPDSEPENQLAIAREMRALSPMHVDDQPKAAMRRYRSRIAQPEVDALPDFEAEPSQALRRPQRTRLGRRAPLLRTLMRTRNDR